MPLFSVESYARLTTELKRTVIIEAETPEEAEANANNIESWLSEDYRVIDEPPATDFFDHEVIE